MTDAIHLTDADGNPVRLRTKKLGVTIFRQRAGTAGSFRFTDTWYFKKMVAGQLGVFPLGLSARSAERLAEEIASFLSIPSNSLAMAQEKYNPRSAEREAVQVATIGQCIDAYHGALKIIGRRGKSISEPTYKIYRNGMLTFLRKIDAYRKGVPFETWSGQRSADFSPWLNLPVSHLTAKAVMDFKLACLPDPPAGEDEPDAEDVLTAQITGDTVIRCARAFFAEQALKYYAEAGLRLPNLAGFLKEHDFGARKYFVVLPPEVIVPIMRASLELRMADVDAYRAFMLTMHCGLRAGEALAFQPSWVRQEDKPRLYVHVRGAFSPKHQTGRKVTLEPWVADVLKELGPIESAEALDRLNAWLRPLIPAENHVNKPTHELRKLWTSAKAKTDGIFEAVKQAGHKEIKVTANHYADAQMADWLTPLWQRPTVEVIQLPQFKAKAS